MNSQGRSRRKLVLVLIGALVLVTVANEAGALNVVAGKLSDAGINIKKCYATAGGGDVAVVLDTADNEKAASLL